MRAALALSALLDNVSGLIRQKETPCACSTDVLDTCFNFGGAKTEHTVTNAKEAILETAVTSASMQLSRQIEAMWRTVAASGNPEGPDGPHGQRAGVAASLLHRLRLEVVEPMTHLQSQRKTSAAAHEVSGELVRHPLWRFRPGVEASRRRALLPVPWEVDSRDAERDRADHDE